MEGAAFAGEDLLASLAGEIAHLLDGGFELAAVDDPLLVERGILGREQLGDAPLQPDNVRRRVLKPLMEEIGAPWAGWHALRHSYASIQIANRVNIVALSRTLGHHSPAFTLSRYAHLLDGDQAPPLNLAEHPHRWIGGDRD